METKEFLEIQDICKRLYKDYNGDIIEEIENNEIKDVFRNISEKYKDGNKGNIPLLNIIYNHFYEFLPAPDYISGPITLTYQTSEKYNMKIYIFGEAHSDIKTCNEIEGIENSMNISNYLYQTFLNTDKFIDFYIEDRLYPMNEFKEATALITILRNDFHKCLNPAKRNECVFKTIRSHFVDARFIEKGEQNIGTNSTLHILQTLDPHDDRQKLKKDELKQIQKILSLKTYGSIADYIIELALSIKIIKKEFDRCYLDKKLFLEVFRKSLIERLEYRLDIKEFLTFSIYSSNMNLYNILVIITSPILEFYMIARVFKEFKKTNYFPRKPKYIVFYGGDSHSELFRLFLDKLGFNIMFGKRSKSRCLDMRGVALDFK